MPKTRNAFALRELYNVSMSFIYDEVNGTYIDCPVANMDYFFGDDYKFTPVTFEETKNRANSTVENFKYVKKEKKRLDRHMARLQRYSDTALCADKLQRAKMLFENYVRLDEAFQYLNNALFKYWQDDTAQLKALYQKSNGDRLRKARFRKGYTQAELARMLGVPMATYASYERGDRDIPTFMFYRLSKILDVSADEILGIPPK